MAGRAGVSRYGDGQSTLDTRIGQQGDGIVSELHGGLYEQAVRRNLFFSLSMVRATSLPATAMIGNIVYNPPDSGVNLAMQQWNSHIVVTSATTTGIGLAASYQTTVPTTVTAADATGSTFLSLSGATNLVFQTGKAKAYAIATLLIAPTLVALLHHNTAAIATTGIDVAQGTFEGGLIVPPGGIICMAAIGTAVAAAGHSSWMTWEEVPIL